MIKIFLAEHSLKKQSIYREVWFLLGKLDRLPVPKLTGQETWSSGTPGKNPTDLI